MFVTYILQSTSTGRFYVGHTADIEARLRQHNAGRTQSTRQKGPWSIVHVEEYMTKSEAVKREFQIKKYKGGEAFKKLLGK